MLQIIKNNIASIGLNQIQRFKNAIPYEPDEAIATSLLDTPIYSNLVFKEGSFEDAVTGQLIKYPSLRVDSAIMVVSGEKNIIETVVQGRDGSIKEFIANNDFRIAIAGRIISPNINVSPVEEKNALISICKAKTSIEVTSQFLNDFGIYNIVINNYNIEEREGYRNIIPFSISAVSDIPFDIELQQENNT